MSNRLPPALAGAVIASVEALPSEALARAGATTRQYLNGVLLQYHEHGALTSAQAAVLVRVSRDLGGPSCLL